MLTIIKKAIGLVPKQPKQIKVTLPELATIWLKYNQPYQAQKTEEVQEIITDAPEETEKGQPEGVRKRLGGFYDDLIGPYQELLVRSNSLEGISRIMELLDAHGGCPSVVETAIEKDSETDEIYSIRDTLLKVTLLDHTIKVTKIALNLLKETYREKDYETLVPKMLVVALGHDIGKIPALRESGFYVKADHPLISAQKVAEIFSDQNIPWLNDALEIIKSHHRQTQNPLSAILKEADGRAREIEVAEVNKEISIKEWGEWFHVPAFLELIKPHINVIGTDKKWRAFLFGGYVYCMTDLLQEAARKLMTQKKVIDKSLLRTEDREIALKKIANSLMNAGILGDLPEGYYGRYYDVQTGKTKKKFFLTPLKSEFLETPIEVETIIDSVTLAKK